MALITRGQSILFYSANPRSWASSKIGNDFSNKLNNKIENTNKHFNKESALKLLFVIEKKSSKDSDDFGNRNFQECFLM